MPAYRIVVTPAADRQLAKLPHQAREMLGAALVALGSNPRPAGCVKLTDSQDLGRIRIGDYRVLYQIRDDRLLITVVKIGDRKDVYR